MHEDPPTGATRLTKDYERQLGVVECLTAIVHECPSGPVRAITQGALEAIENGGAAIMREQVYYVLSALQGWRGERASQVHASLSSFYEGSARPEEDA